ncbi:MAG: hypothetical protein ACRD9R_05115 [Pyrinomonadaceae bacterium]
MLTGSTLKPGQKGTKKLVVQYGSQLLCVRYRYDAQRKRRYKTIELIVDECAWEPPAKKSCKMVQLRVGAQERDWQNKVRGAGGRWNPAARVWELRYDRAVEIGAKSRIVKK